MANPEKPHDFSNEESASPFSAPDLTPSSPPKTAAQRLRETPNVGTEAANASHVQAVHPPASSVAIPQPSENPPMPGGADTGKGVATRIDPPLTTERNDLTATNAPGSVPTEQPEHLRAGLQRIPHMNTAASDAEVLATIPQLGDTVRVSVDGVDYMKRRPHHNALIGTGANGQLGTVIGQQVIGDTLFLRVEGPSFNQLVPYDCCLKEEPLRPAVGSQMQEPRISPERMRKPSDGSYNKT